MRDRIAFLSSAALAVALLLPGTSKAAELQDRTRSAYDIYVATVEKKMMARHASGAAFLNLEQLPVTQRAQVETRLRGGEVLIEKIDAGAVPAGMIHHWRGTAFLPAARMAGVLSTVQDYNAFARNYQSEVMSSALLKHEGNDFQFAMRLRKHKVITVVLDTVSTVHFGRLDADHLFSTSRMTRIAEVADLGARTEHSLPPGNDNGFLWRMDTYWSYVQAKGGVFVECETISLTRDVPFGLKHIIGPFIESVPRESLEFTLKATRDAVSRTTSAKH